MFAFSAMSILLLTGCGQNSVPNAVVKVKPTKVTVQFPKETDIQSVYVVAGLATGSYVPKNQSATISQIVDWLKTAEPVSVQFPQFKSKKQFVTNAYTGPAALILHLNAKENVTISPAYYIWTNAAGGEIVNHYVNGVVGYQIGSKTMYFKDPAIYQWLKDNQWTKEFKVAS